MKIKATWGFIGDAKRLGTDSSHVKPRQVLDDVEDEYAHLLIGKGLATQVGGKSPNENRAATTAPPAAAMPASTPKPAATEVKATDDEKASLIAALEKAEVKFDKRWGVDKLREALAEAGSK